MATSIHDGMATDSSTPRNLRIIQEIPNIKEGHNLLIGGLVKLRTTNPEPALTIATISQQRLDTIADTDNDKKKITQESYFVFTDRMSNGY